MGDRRRRISSGPALGLLVLGCFALAALSLVLPSVPDKDPWSWIVWGREVVHLDLDTGAGSSWKPLPVLFTTPLSLFHGIAPELWLVVARAGGLLAVLFAYRIAARLAGPVAGAVAAVCLIGADWARLLGHGNIEPLSTGLALGAIDRHLDGHRVQAVALGALAALGRIELWPLLVLYALWAFLQEAGVRRVGVIALVLVVPVLWLGGDLIGSGDAFRGSKRAAGFQERSVKRAEKAARRTGRPVEEQPSAISRTFDGAGDLLILPALVAALVGIVAAAVRLRRRVRREGRRAAARSPDATTLALALAAAALFALVTVMSLRGYGGSPRFLFPAAALVCVLAGVGVATLLSAAGGGLRAAAVGALVIAASVPFAADRVRHDDRSLRAVGLSAQLQEDLDST
ncbi:MAG: glycosyltransferase 87 family protein, partial [Thermoleophilaceae bacterium]